LLRWLCRKCFFDTMCPLNAPRVLIMCSRQGPFAFALAPYIQMYWTAMIYYTEFCLVFRYFCNFDLYGTGSADWTSPAYHPGLEPGRSCTDYDYSHGCDSFARVVGVVRQNASGPGYLYRLVPEVILLWCLGYHRSVLVRMGKWHLDGNRLQEYVHSLYRHCL
jgi:hypothetical protein